MNKGSTTDSYTDIDYALYFHRGSRIYVYENGANRGQFGTYKTGSVGIVRVNQINQVEYVVDDEVRYISLTAPKFPLNVDVSFHDEGGALEDIKWVAASKLADVPAKVGAAVS